jgi:hypothetical protein
MPWHHISPIPGDPAFADIRCSNLLSKTKFFVVGDFDSDGFTELVVVPDASGSRGNDLWVMKYNVAAASWQHMAPIPNHPMDADIDCSGRRFPAKFFVVADFDGDSADELLVAPNAAGSRGNDLWVMKYNMATGSWQHMAPIPNHEMDADIDCSGRQFRAKFAIAADFDGDGRAELVVAPDVSGTRGNDLWVMKYVGTFPNGAWQHMAAIPNHAMDADIDCSGLQFAAKFVCASDFDGDRRNELVIAPEAAGSRGNDLWVMKYVGRFPDGRWQHMAPIPNHPMEADIDCSGRQFPAKFMVAGDFDHDDRAELIVAPDAARSRGNDLWVMKYVGRFPDGTWQHMAPIPNHPMEADIDCSGREFPAKFAVVADFDGDGADELMVAPDAAGSRGNDLWVMKYVGTFPNGAWQHMAPIPNHAMDADIDCSGLQFAAKFAVAGDFDHDGAAELVVLPEGRPFLYSSVLWVMKYFGAFPSGVFDHMSPIGNDFVDADIFVAPSAFPVKATLVGVFNGQGPELVVAPDVPPDEVGESLLTGFWTLEFDRGYFWVLGFDRAAPIYVGDANDPATILADSDVFYSTYFASRDDVAEINAATPDDSLVDWERGGRISALVQMYDLVAPLDGAQAARYLERLGHIAGALLDKRDDVRGSPADPFRDRVMPAWGGKTKDRDCGWNTDVVTSGFFTYAMAAFARRVADDPALHPQYGPDAIRFINSTMETYEAFRPELHLVDTDAQAYFIAPLKYASLHCNRTLQCDMSEDEKHMCEGYRDGAGKPIAYNENFSMMQALAEAALAADSPLYRGSPEATPEHLRLATEEAPLLIAKNFTFFDNHLRSKTLSDGTPYFEWYHSSEKPPGLFEHMRIEDTGHGGFELGCLAVILDDQIRLNGLLERAGRSERVALSAPLFLRFANTFLRKIWHYDYQNASGLRNVLDEKVDGTSNPTEAQNANTECAGWIPLAQFNRWIWIRCRDATFHAPGYLREATHAALLRYRQFL